MNLSAASSNWNEHTEYLMLEADCLLNNAGHEVILSFDTVMKTWEELGLPFAERLELALERLRTGHLFEASPTVLQ